tara:strand:- start:986 stop:1171 length:186 start_codon:yes stop_codon:yes gene_type:complete
MQVVEKHINLHFAMDVITASAFQRRIVQLVVADIFQPFHLLNDVGSFSILLRRKCLGRTER